MAFVQGCAAEGQVAGAGRRPRGGAIDGLPEGSLINGSGLKFSNFDLPHDKKDAGQNIRSAIGVWQWQQLGARQVYPAKLATSEITMVPLPPWSKR